MVHIDPKNDFVVSTAAICLTGLALLKSTATWLRRRAGVPDGARAALFPNMPDGRQSRALTRASAESAGKSLHRPVQSDPVDAASALLQVKTASRRSGWCVGCNRGMPTISWSQRQAYQSHGMYYPNGAPAGHCQVCEEPLTSIVATRRC